MSDGHVNDCHVCGFHDCGFHDYGFHDCGYVFYLSLHCCHAYDHVYLYFLHVYDRDVHVHDLYDYVHAFYLSFLHVSACDLCGHAHDRDDVHGRVYVFYLFIILLLNKLHHVHDHDDVFLHHDDVHDRDAHANLLYVYDHSSWIHVDNSRL